MIRVTLLMQFRVWNFDLDQIGEGLQSSCNAEADRR